MTPYLTVAGTGCGYGSGDCHSTTTDGDPGTTTTVGVPPRHPDTGAAPGPLVAVGIVGVLVGSLLVHLAATVRRDRASLPDRAGR